MMLAAKKIYWIASHGSLVKPMLASEIDGSALVMRALKAGLTMRGKLNCGEQPCVVTKACLQMPMRAG